MPATATSESRILNTENMSFAFKLLNEMASRAPTLPWWDGSVSRTIAKMWRHYGDELLCNHFAASAENDPEWKLAMTGLMHSILDPLAEPACEEYIEGLTAISQGLPVPRRGHLATFNSIMYGIEQALCQKHACLFLRFAPDTPLPLEQASRTTALQVYGMGGSSTVIFEPKSNVTQHARVTFIMISALSNPIVTTPVGSEWFRNPSPLIGGPAASMINDHTVYAVSRELDSTGKASAFVEGVVIPKCHFGFHLADYVRRRAHRTQSEGLKRALLLGITHIVGAMGDRAGQN